MQIVQVDSFTDTPFTGNPAAVCVLDAAADATWMQNVALEMNLAETAFLVPRADGSYDLRWFTPTVEVDLCGHATLASAHILWEDKHTDAGILSFHTRSGVLTAQRDDPWIELDFPARPVAPIDDASDVVAAVGGNPIVVATGEVGGGYAGYLLEYATEDEVRAIVPNGNALLALDNGYAIVTAPASMPGYDFVSRFFAPAAGVAEDPVTGSAHCALAPWWQAKLGKDEMLGFQCSARGGTVRVRPRGDRVRLGGRAVTVMRGDLLR